jgi:hypothetical protein
VHSRIPATKPEQKHHLDLAQSTQPNRVHPAVIMAEHAQPNQELEAILKTLASLSQQQPSPPQHPHPTHASAQNSSEFQDGQFKPSSERIAAKHSYSDPRLMNPSAQQRQPPFPPVPQARSSTPTIDPATITEWKQGLRCVIKVAAQNPNFAASVRKVQKRNLAVTCPITHAVCS